MSRNLPGILIGLLLILVVVACTPGTTRDELTSQDDNSGIAGDSSTDSSDRISKEPPLATLMINGREQTAGITGYCWQQGDGTGISADGRGVTTDPTPISAESTFLAQFGFQFDARPGRVHLSIFPASEPIMMGPEQNEWRYWRPVPGDQFTLPPKQDPTIEVTLEPGIYVFNLFVEWPDYGEVFYGFLVGVDDALLPDTAIFVDDHGLPLDEAVYRSRFEETIDELQALLMIDLADVFGGLWIESQPEYQIMIALTQGGMEIIRPYLADYEWSDLVKVQPTTYTLEKLKADQAIAVEIANSVQGVGTAAIDIVNNKVEFIVDNPDIFLNNLAQANIELPDSVVVLPIDQEGKLPETNGGVLLESKTSDDRAIYLPVQPLSRDSMMALLEGTLVEVNGCLRVDDGYYVDGWLVIWPHGSDIRVSDNRIEVINADGELVARVGERFRGGGGAIENTQGMAALNEIIPGMPIDGCPGPYWVAAPLETMLEQTVPDIFFQPFSSGDQIVAWFVNQSLPSPEIEVLTGELMLDKAGCLRLEEYLLILPPETYLREDPLRIVDRVLGEIAKIGDSIQVTGAEKDSNDYRYFDNKVQCSGPYWGVNQISTAE